MITPDDFKFRDRDHVIEKLVGDDGAAKYQRWAWAEFLERLDKAGYRIVAKPELRERGVPSRNSGA